MNRLDEIFGKKAYDFELKPSSDAWHQVRAGLDSEKNRFPMKVIWRSAAVIALLISVYFAGYFSGVSQEKVLSESPVQEQIPARITMPEVADLLAADQNEVQTKQKPVMKPVAPAPAPSLAINGQADPVFIEPVTETPTVNRVELMMEVSPVRPEYRHFGKTDVMALTMVEDIQPKKTMIIRNEALALIEQARNIEPVEYLTELRAVKNDLLSIDWNSFSKKVKTQN